ncbi:hypothetical protein [Dietzia sp. CH92]|uniref:hypothetical protein n=1 Tax=Dietzia sp. CH92 TaxID=3051823 RepID=UPI0028D72824|nr:hypothetical protein [Dietzia sp. CH92]
MTLSRRPRRALPSAVATLAAALAVTAISAPLAGAATGSGSLGGSSGPAAPATPLTPPAPVAPVEVLTDLTVSADLTCGIRSAADGLSLFATPEACATLVLVDDRLFGPADIGFEAYEPLLQTESGAGTAADPRVIRTVVGVGAADTGLTLTQVDRVVDGTVGYWTDITVDNASGEDRGVKVYRAVDCFPEGTDGTGALYGRSVACVDAAGRRIAFTNLTGGASRQAGFYNDIWAAPIIGIDFDDTAGGDVLDNGMGLNWSVTVPAGRSVELRSRFELDQLP